MIIWFHSAPVSQEILLKSGLLPVRTIASGTRSLKAVGAYFLVHPRNCTSFTKMKRFTQFQVRHILYTFASRYSIKTTLYTCIAYCCLLLTLPTSFNFIFHRTVTKYRLASTAKKIPSGDRALAAKSPELNGHVNRKIMELNGWVSS